MSDPFDSTQYSLNPSPLDDPKVLSGPFWGELRVFLAVAKAKSFNRAAEELNMSQPTVSRHVRRLQDIIGSQLVVPSQSGVTLTEKGKNLARMLLMLDEKLFEISHDLKAETREAEGMVRVRVTEGLAGLFIAPNLVAFGEHYPKIQLHLRNPNNLTNFRENQTDVMIGFAPINQAGVTSRQLGFFHFIPIASHTYIKRYGLPTRENLESHFFIDSDYYSAQTDIWEPWRTAMSRGIVAHRCDNSYAYALLVKAGAGIGLVANFALAAGESVPLDIGVEIRFPLFAYVETERLAARPVRLVYDWLSSLLGPQNHWFAHELNLHCPSSDMVPEAVASVIAGYDRTSPPAQS